MLHATILKHKRPALGQFMHHVLKVDPDHGLFIVETVGEATVEGMRTLLDDMIAHPVWRGGMGILMDHRRLTFHATNAKDVEFVSDYFASFSDILGNSKLAMVVNRDVDFGVARAWENMTMDRTKVQTHVFRSLDEGRAWLSKQD